MATINLSWVLPTQREDGSALPDFEVRHVSVEMSEDDRVSFASVGEVAAPATRLALSNKANGTYIFRARAVDSEGRRSTINEIVVTVVEDDGEPDGSRPNQVTEFRASVSDGDVVVPVGNRADDEFSGYEDADGNRTGYVNDNGNRTGNRVNGQGVDVPSVNPPSVYDRRVDAQGNTRINNGDRVDADGDLIDDGGDPAAVGNQFGTRTRAGNRNGNRSGNREAANKARIAAQEQRELAKAKRARFDRNGNPIS